MSTVLAVVVVSVVTILILAFFLAASAVLPAALVHPSVAGIPVIVLGVCIWTLLFGFPLFLYSAALGTALRQQRHATFDRHSLAGRPDNSETR